MKQSMTQWDMRCTDKHLSQCHELDMLHMGRMLAKRHGNVQQL